MRRQVASHSQATTGDNMSWLKKSENIRQTTRIAATSSLLIIVVSIGNATAAATQTTAYAFGGVTATPTLGPTKTAAATTSTNESQQATPILETASFAQHSLTQADLSVLTGNVQRPNGVTWHDGNLYASCSGD